MGEFFGDSLYRHAELHHQKPLVNRGKKILVSLFAVRNFLELNPLKG